MKINKLMENVAKSGEIEGIYVHDIQSPDTIKVLKDGKVIFKISREYAADVIKVLIKLK